MPTFRILPVDLDAKQGWIVETTHDDGVVNKSISYPTKEKAQEAADSWIYLDEDWGKI